MQLPDVDHVPEFCFCWRHVRIRHLSTEGCVTSSKSKDATRGKCFKPSAQIPNSLLNVTSLAHGNFLCPARFPSTVVTIETIDTKRHSLETPKFHESKVNISSKRSPYSVFFVISLCFESQSSLQAGRRRRRPSDNTLEQPNCCLSRQKLRNLSLLVF